MIAHLRGRLISKHPNQAIVEAAGVGYDVTITVPTFSDLPALGSEVALRSAIPGEDEQLFEVDRFLPGHMVSLVGAYSILRRIDFRVESKSQVVRVTARVDYPSYGGALGALFDRMTTRRRLESALGDSLVHFKGLAEFGAANGAPLEDF